jgi:Zn-dependent protease
MPPISDLFNNPTGFILFIVVLLMALTVHEAAHAYAAKLLGDDTAELLGRLSLNPLVHLDPLGTLAMLVAGVGWAKPVPVNTSNFTNPRLHNLFVALAGPASNLLLAIVFAVFSAIFKPDPSSLAAAVTTLVIYFNIVLMLFNLIPIPPLDGSKILHLFMSDESFYTLEQYGTYILLGLILLGRFGIPILSTLIFGPTQFLLNLLT